MELKFVVAALLALTTLVHLTEAQNNLLDCNSRRRNNRQRGQFANESRQEARNRRRRERCICRPDLPQCGNSNRRPDERQTPAPPPPPPPPPPTNNIQSIRRSLRAFIDRNVPRRLPAAMQLVFHSCVGRTGCDGCINTRTRDNIGLIQFNNDVIALWRELGQPISIADFVVLLGTVSVEMGMSRRGGPGPRTVPFRTGRTGCDNPNNYQLNHVFPQGEDPNSLEFLMREFGISRRLAIALMGAHSLGRCRRENSGFDGEWDNTPEVLDNGYYQSLGSTTWRLTDARNGFTQWSNDNRMMLHADMSLIKDLRINSGQDPTCRSSNQCRVNNADNTQVRRYVRNEAEWADDFQNAFLRMVNH